MRIFVPLGTGSRWANNELKHMLRSLSINCKCEIDITIYNTPYNAIQATSGVDLQEVDRYYPEKFKGPGSSFLFENYYDTLNKLRTFCMSEDCPDRFVYMYDDHLLIKPIESFDFIDNTALFVVKNWHLRGNDLTRHERTIKQALDLAHREKKRNGLYNYETHAPKLFERDKLRKMFSLYDFREMDVPYSVATLYFNLFFERPQRVLDEQNGFIARFGMDEVGGHSYWNLNGRQIQEAIADKYWVNYSDKALHFSNANTGSRPLMAWIEARFPDQCKYEA